MLEKWEKLLNIPLKTAHLLLSVIKMNCIISIVHLSVSNSPHMLCCVYNIYIFIRWVLLPHSWRFCHYDDKYAQLVPPQRFSSASVPTHVSQLTVTGQIPSRWNQPPSVLWPRVSRAGPTDFTSKLYNLGIRTFSLIYRYNSKVVNISMSLAANAFNLPSSLNNVQKSDMFSIVLYGNVSFVLFFLWYTVAYCALAWFLCIVCCYNKTIIKIMSTNGKY